MKEIQLKSRIVNDEFTEYVYDAFDIQNRKEVGVKISYDFSELNDFEWNIGLVVGPSGSGKTSILKDFGKIKKPVFKKDTSLISNFDWMSPEEAGFLLTSIGLSSVPSWLKPFSVLSTGEKYRADLAMILASSKNEVVLIDEYTSVVDRNVAKAMSYSLQKYAKRNKKKIILASCHYDIIEWLNPDWICSIKKGGTIERRDRLRPERPEIELCVSRVEAEAWNIFKEHHYMNEDINKSNSFLLFEWQEQPVGICSYSPMPSGTLEKAYRLSGTVVLPDYQGMGIGKNISNFTAGILKNEGYRVFTKTVNPALGIYREKSDVWKASTKNGRIRTEQFQNSIRNKKWFPLQRKSYCFEYSGKGIKGYSDILMKIEDQRKTKEIRDMTYDFDLF